ncbi:MAG: hypothetical protein ACRDPT_06535 [Streptomycetales bacterium]
MLAGLALGGEIGHLAAATVEWPVSTPRGVFHIVVAALLGLFATRLYVGASRTEQTAGAVLCLLLPICWLALTLVGVSPYRDTPTALALLLSTAELALTALLSRPPLHRAG